LRQRLPARERQLLLRVQALERRVSTSEDRVLLTAIARLRAALGVTRVGAGKIG
jgi:hypothetical protein